MVPTAVAACAARGEGGSPTGVSLQNEIESNISIREVMLRKNIDHFAVLIVALTNISLEAQTSIPN